MKWFLTFVALSALIAAGTWFGGWPVVAVIGAGWGAGSARKRGVIFTAALAGAAGWGALLAWDALTGPVGRLLQVFGAFSHLPGSAFVVLTVAYPALLCAAAAALTRGLVLFRSPK